MSRKNARARRWTERVEGHVPTDAELRHAAEAIRANGGDWSARIAVYGVPTLVRYHERDSYTGGHEELVTRPSLKDRCGDSIVANTRPLTRRPSRVRSRGRKIEQVAPATCATPASLRPLPAVETDLYNPVTWYDATGEGYILE